MVPACYTQHNSALVQCGSSKSKLGNAAVVRPSPTPRTRESASGKKKKKKSFLAGHLVVGQVEPLLSCRSQLSKRLWYVDLLRAQRSCIGDDGLPTTRLYQSRHAISVPDPANSWRRVQHLSSDLCRNGRLAENVHMAR